MYFITLIIDAIKYTRTNPDTTINIYLLSFGRYVITGQS